MANLLGDIGEKVKETVWGINKNGSFGECAYRQAAMSGVDRQDFVRNIPDGKLMRTQ